jgi:hypothetical protein
MFNRLQVGAVKERVDHVKERIAWKSHELLNKWEEKSREFVSNFVELFGRDGRINHWLREGRLKVARAISPPPRFDILDDDDDDDSESSRDISPNSSSREISPASSPLRKRSRLRFSHDPELSDDYDSDKEDF